MQDNDKLHSPAFVDILLLTDPAPTFFESSRFSILVEFLTGYHKFLEPSSVLCPSEETDKLLGPPPGFSAF